MVPGPSALACRVDARTAPRHGVDGDGKLVGITIVNAKQLLDGAKPIVITIPERVTIDHATLAPAIQSAA